MLASNISQIQPARAPKGEPAIPGGSGYAVPYAPGQPSRVKEIALYSFLGAAGVGAIIYFGKKFIDGLVESKAHSKSFEDGTPETYAKQIKMAFENDGYWGTNTVALRTVMQQIKSKAEMDKIYTAYRKEYHSNLYEDMQKELQSTEYNEMLQIIEGKPATPGQKPNAVQYKAWAKRLKAAFDKEYGFIPGTDEPAIKAVFDEIPSKQDFVNMGIQYTKDYGVNLITALKAELEPWEYADYMTIILKKPKN